MREDDWRNVENHVEAWHVTKHVMKQDEIDAHQKGWEENLKHVRFADWDGSGGGFRKLPSFGLGRVRHRS